jgi:hypothetical protein
MCYLVIKTEIMPKAELIDEDVSPVTFWNGHDEQLGSDMDFVCIKSKFKNSVLLARMYVPVKQIGLGRADLYFFQPRPFTAEK